jgi:MFS family permease
MFDFGSRLQRGHWSGWIFWGFAAIFFLYEFFVRVMPSVILPDLAQELAASPMALSSALAVYLWVYAPMQLVVGGLFDRFGTKFLIVGAAAICGGGCLIFGLGDSLMAIGLARGMAGFGSAFAFVGAVYVATVWFPPSRLALIAGITTAVGILGEVIGQTPMVEAVAAFGWRPVVLTCGWAGIIYAGVLLLVIPRRPAWFQERFNPEDETQFSILRGVLRVLVSWPIWGLGIVSAVLYLPLSVVAAMWGNTFMETAGGYTAKEASFATIMLASGWLIGSPLVGILSDRIRSRRWPLIVGSIGGGMTMLLLLWPSLLGYGGLLTVMFVGGIFTSTQVVCFAAAMEVCPKPLRGTATACINFITMLLAAGMQLWIGWVLTAEIVSPHLHHGKLSAIKPATMLAEATAYQFRWAMAIIPALFLVALLICLILPETAGRTARPNTDTDRAA